MKLSFKYTAANDHIKLYKHVFDDLIGNHMPIKLLNNDVVDSVVVDINVEDGKTVEIVVEIDNENSDKIHGFSFTANNSGANPFGLRS